MSYNGCSTSLNFNYVVFEPGDFPPFSTHFRDGSGLKKLHPQKKLVNIFLVQQKSNYININ